MNLMISEVQITFVILMGLITLCLVFSITHYAVVGKTFDAARKFLAGGTFLVTIHFIIQYLIHKTSPIGEDNWRTLVNLSFGIPISYLFNISNYYLQRRGGVSMVNWLFAPVSFVFSMVILVVCLLLGFVGMATLLMAIIYAVTLVYYAVIQVKEYYHIMYNIRHNGDSSLIHYIKWMKWSLFCMVVIAFGFPIMTFNTNLLMRSLYGILSIASGFFYVFSFMGYGVYGSALLLRAKSHDMIFPDDGGEAKLTSVTTLVRELKESAQKVTTKSDTGKSEKIEMLVRTFEEGDSYLKSGITLKEVSEEMGISAYMLRSWLKTTKFEKFNNWIIYLKLEKAKKLLRECPELGNDAIADRCGFCDRQYFQLQFRKHFGMTPSRWVKEDYSSEE